MTHYYLLYMKEALKNKEDLHIIRYEDVIYNTEETLKKLCDYTNIPISIKQIQHWKAKQEAGRSPESTKMDAKRLHESRLDTSGGLV